MRSLSLAFPKDKSGDLPGEPKRGGRVCTASLISACNEGADFDVDNIVGNIRGGEDMGA